MNQCKKSCIILLSVLHLGLGAIIKPWDWTNVNFDSIVMPKLCGVALSEYQNSGAFLCKSSNWAAWEKKKVHNGNSTIKHDHESGIACDFFNSYQSDIPLIKDLGANSLRLSIEWSILEPEEGIFDATVMQHYIDLIDALLEQGIVPMITLHHFTHPEWFEQMGGFANEENIFYFVRFCEYVFEHLSDKVSLWCTINEIGAFVFQGYIHGTFPPGKQNILLAGKVMRTMLKAHCQVYKALKKLSNGNKAQIGLVHAYLPFEPHTTNRIPLALTSLAGYALVDKLVSLTLDTTSAKTAKAARIVAGTAFVLNGLNAIETIPASFMNYIFNDAILHFLKTGNLFPLIPGLQTTIHNAPQLYDFIGINCYSRVVLESKIFKNIVTFDSSDPVGPSCRTNEIMTDMQYPICAETLYNAIVQCSELNVPIYITENGIPDAADDRRALFIKRYLYVVSEALKEGYDIRGYYYWSLMDNFEWDEGWVKKFGLYKVNLETQERTLRDGARVYQHILHNAVRL